MRIFRHIFTATLGVAMTASLSSCLNSWLDQTPADGIDAETAINCRHRDINIDD